MKTMFRLFNCFFFCWIHVSVLLYGSPAFVNISTHNRLQNVTELESSFLQLRARLPSYSQPIRPYSLLTNADDYHYMPKTRHRRPSQLLRLLGSSFDPFWMSIDPPPEALGDHKEGQPFLQDDTLPPKILNHTTFKMKFNSSSSPELKEAAENHRQNLKKEVGKLDLGFLSSDVARSVRAWLVQSATCELLYRWVDLGPAFWPRWLRQTDCESSDRVQSCSFPSGMECVRARTTHIKILAWHCAEIGGGGDKSWQIKAEKSDGSIEVGTGEAIKRCLWRQVPYPVVAACTCSCK